MFDSGVNEQVDKELIQKERFSLYMNGMLREFFGSIIAGLPLFYFIFHSQASQYSAIIWFSLDAILMVSVLITYYIFHLRFSTFDYPTWLKISNIPLVIFSLYLAVAPWLFLQLDADIYMYTMFIMIISFTGIVTQTIAYYFDKFVIFSTLPLLSLAIKFYTMQSDNTFETYCVLILIWCALINFAYGINKKLNRSITLTFEHLQARSKAERMNSEKSLFIAAVSHDIRQPVQAINFFVSTLKSRNTDTENDVTIERLEKSVDSMSELLNSMLDVSKLDAHVIVPKPQHICLTTLIKKLHGELTPIANAKCIDLIIESEDYTVFADIILLEQVLNNLLSNAIRYTHSGHITIITSANADQVTISIKDTGIGIAPSEHEAIFLEFHQLANPERDQSKGLGLGLSIVKRLCELQRWPLSFSSEEGLGSCFNVCLPQGKEALIEEPKRLNLNETFTIMDIIVIDDNEDVRLSLSHILSDWGCEVHSFVCAKSACHAIKKQPDWKPNLIISDYRLQENKTGLEAIQLIQSLLSYSIESIIISGDTASQKIEEIKECGVTLLHKPIKPAKLRVAIHHKSKRVN